MRLNKKATSRWFERLLVFVVSSVRTRGQITESEDLKKSHIFDHLHNWNLVISFSTGTFFQNLTANLILSFAIAYESSQKIEMSPSKRFWRTPFLYKWYTLRTTLSKKHHWMHSYSDGLHWNEKLLVATPISWKLVITSLFRVSLINTKCVKGEFLNKW